MAQIHPHINFNGNAEEAFLFYQGVFGGEFTKTIRFKDIASDEFPVPEHEANKIMQIALSIGNGLLMANDVPEAMGRTNENENRSKIVVTADSKVEATRIFEGLSVGGQVEIPLLAGPTGDLFAMFRDKYGLEWMVEYSATAGHE